MSRDDRLDVWRGLCLVDVVLVHLAPGVGSRRRRHARVALPGGLPALAAPWPRLARAGAALAVAASLATLVVSHAPLPAVTMTVVDDADTIGDALEPASDVDVTTDLDASPADEPRTPDVEPDVTLG